MIAVELVADRGSKQPFERSRHVTERLVTAAFDRGLTVYPASGGLGSEGDAIMFGPPFVIMDQELARMVEIVVEAVEAVL